MKKMIFAALMAVAALGASAQVENGLQLGVQGMIGANSITQDGTKAALSYGAGVVLEYGIDNNLYVGSGLNFQNKGWKVDIKDAETNNVYYLTLPIHIGYRFNVTDAAAIHFQAGPQLAYAVGGNHEYSDWGKPFEVGVGLKVGTELNNHFQINLGANYGFTKTVKGAEALGLKLSKDYGNNLDFTAGVAYMF